MIAISKVDSLKSSSNFLRLAIANLSCYFIFGATQVNAQIVPDMTLSIGQNSMITNETINGLPSYRIEGGSIRGENLFHSFSEFNVGLERGAYFNSPPSINNILTRVTGINSSNIQGTLGVLGNSNLFFMNPNGIVFGPNANLDLSGSFLATSASDFVFESNGMVELFSAINPQSAALLAVNFPIGLQFLNSSDSIDVHSFFLEVPVGKTLSFVGSDLTLRDAILLSSGGRIELGSVGGENIVKISQNETGFELDFDDVLNFKDIYLNNSLIISTPVFGPSIGSGDIQLFGKQIDLTNISLISSRNESNDRGGELKVFASESLEFQGGSSLETEGPGPSGELIIDTQKLVLNDSSSILAGNTDSGSGGDLIIDASNSIIVAGNSEVSSVTFGGGLAGNLIVTTEQLTLLDGGQLTTSVVGTASLGDGGNLTINASEFVKVKGVSTSGVSESPSRITAQTTGVGNSGTLNIHTKNFDLQDGGRISVAALEGSTGQAGVLAINATESFLVNGVGSVVLATSASPQPAGIISIATADFAIRNGGIVSASTSGSGEAGQIQINADTFSITGDSSRLLSSTSNTGSGGNIDIVTKHLNVFDGAQISTTTTGPGDAGRIDVKASNSVTLTGSDSGLFATTTSASTGQGGSIFVDPPIVLIRDQAGIGVDSQGSGPAGNISLAAGDLILDNGGFISAETALGQGGNIALNIDNTLLMQGGSRITVTAGQASGTGDGGKIDASTQFLIANSLENNDITANAFQSKGGNILITTDSIIGFRVGEEPSSFSSDITATSELGVAGSIVINRPEVDPTSGLSDLPTVVVDPSQVVAQTCPGDVGTTAADLGEFVVTGRGGLPPSPSEALRQDAIVTDWVTRNGSVPIQRSTLPLQTQPQITPVPPVPDRIVEAQGWIRRPDGQIVLTAQAPATSTHPSGLPRPDCPRS